MNEQTSAGPFPTTSWRRVSARIGRIAESATLAVDARAKALQAQGRPVIGFGAGEPDVPTPGYVVDAAAQACRLPASYLRLSYALGDDDLVEGIRRLQSLLGEGVPSRA